jgi:hypothetical protein
MIESKAILSVKLEHHSVFSDLTYKTREFGRDEVSIILDADTDFLYVGYSKPINCFFLNHNSNGVAEAITALKYYNGTSWVSVSNLEDDTLGLSRPGLLRWDRELVGQVASLIDGVTKFWYKLSTNTNKATLKLSGINVTFASDFDLTLEQPFATQSEMLGGLTSHILIHTAVRNEIIQYFKGKDYYKLDSNGVKQDLTCWDLMEIGEVNQAAIMLALSKIFFNFSDSKDDIWSSKAYEYRGRYQKFIDKASITIDFNDNGIIESNENKSAKINTFYFNR